MFLIWPVVKRRLASPLSKRRRRLLALAMLAALMAPDADLLMYFWADGKLEEFHKFFSNGLLLAPLFAIPFAFLGRWLTGGRWLFHAVIGCTCYASHILLDFFTWGRGVQLFWPITQTRFSAPLHLFYGVRHSEDVPWWSFLITILNDLAFAFVIWLIAKWRANRTTGASG